jgi:hypothetical protein
MKVIFKRVGQKAIIQDINTNAGLHKAMRLLIDADLLSVAVRCNDMWPDYDLVVYCNQLDKMHNDSVISKINFRRIKDQQAVTGDVVAVKYNNFTLNEEDMTQDEADAVMVMLDTWATYSQALDEAIN